MKTAISISDDVFQEAEKTAMKLGLSRSKLYSLAIEEFVQNHSTDMITTKLNELYDKADSKLDNDIVQATYDLFVQENW
jgi:metal-responsive CopG/Arc/MetJ family transcriptional regulator